MSNKMQPLTLDKQELENVITSESSINNSLGTNVPRFDGKFYIYNVNGSLVAYDSITKYIYVWGLTMHSFYLLNDEILNGAGSLKGVLSMLYHNHAPLELQYQKLSHAIDIISFKSSNHMY
jgi:hypothetical protein